MNRKEKRVIEIARALKPSSYQYRCFHVTVAFHGARMLAINTNKPGKTHTINLRLPYRTKQGDSISDQIGIHSEVAAILNMGLDDCSHINFYNVRIDRNDEINLSKPCGGCQFLLDQVGYKNIFYSTPDGFERLT